MPLYKIAELLVEMNPIYNKLKAQAEKYMVLSNEQPNIIIKLSKEYIIEKQKENPHLSLEDCEYIWYGSKFYSELLKFDGMLLHSSAVLYKNKVYLFSAPSGTGKSTHTALWQKYFGVENAIIINDDKPAIRIIGDEIFAYGTPFSGKTDINENVKAKIGGIIFLMQNEANIIKKATNAEIIENILNQSVRPTKKESYVTLLTLIDKLIAKVPFYNLECNISTDAVQLVYETLNKKEDR